jgi:hypothetical protein
MHFSISIDSSVDPIITCCLFVGGDKAWHMSFYWEKRSDIILRQLNM